MKRDLLTATFCCLWFSQGREPVCDDSAAVVGVDALDDDAHQFGRVLGVSLEVCLGGQGLVVDALGAAVAYSGDTVRPHFRYEEHPPKLTATTGLFAIVTVEVSLLVIVLSILAAASAMIPMRWRRPASVLRRRGDIN